MHVYDRILEMYLEKENWYLPLSVKDDDENSLSLFNVHNNIVQSCLLVEGIGKISRGLEEDFKQYLLKTLYLVLERAGIY